MRPIEGIIQTNRNLDRVERAIREEMLAAIDDDAERVLARSRELAPEDTGRMISKEQSGVFKQDRKGERFFRAVSYKLDYALFQHEGRFRPGQKTLSKPGAGRKFLSRAFDEQRKDALRRYGRRVNLRIRSAIRGRSRTIRRSF